MYIPGLQSLTEVGLGHGVGIIFGLIEINGEITTEDFEDVFDEDVAIKPLKQDRPTPKDHGQISWVGLALDALEESVNHLPGQQWTGDQSLEPGRAQGHLDQVQDPGPILDGQALAMELEQNGSN